MEERAFAEGRGPDPATRDNTSGDFVLGGDPIHPFATEQWHTGKRHARRFSRAMIAVAVAVAIAELRFADIGGEVRLPARPNGLFSC
jgi:hypothetical protein